MTIVPHYIYNLEGSDQLLISEMIAEFKNHVWAPKYPELNDLKECVKYKVQIDLDSCEKKNKEEIRSHSTLDRPYPLYIPIHILNTTYTIELPIWYFAIDFIQIVPKDNPIIKKFGPCSITMSSLIKEQLPYPVPTKEFFNGDLIRYIHKFLSQHTLANQGDFRKFLKELIDHREISMTIRKVIRWKSSKPFASEPARFYLFDFYVFEFYFSLTNYQIINGRY